MAFNLVAAKVLFIWLTDKFSSHFAEHHYYYTWLNATNTMEMEMDVDTRTENYIFISFRWKITVIYCFVVCPLNEWRFFSLSKSKMWNRFFFSCCCGPVTVYVFVELLHVSTNKFQNEITALYNQLKEEKIHDKCIKPNEMSIQMSWKAYLK